MIECYSWWQTVVWRGTWRITSSHKLTAPQSPSNNSHSTVQDGLNRQQRKLSSSLHVSSGGFSINQYNFVFYYSISCTLNLFLYIFTTTKMCITYFNSLYRLKHKDKWIKRLYPTTIMMIDCFLITGASPPTHSHKGEGPTASSDHSLPLLFWCDPIYSVALQNDVCSLGNVCSAASLSTWHWSPYQWPTRTQTVTT